MTDVLNTILCDQLCQETATSFLFPNTTKIYCNNRTEILLYEIPFSLIANPNCQEVRRGPITCVELSHIIVPVSRHDLDF
jgi:hypothetical protein